MKFSQCFELNLPQAALDFVDVDLETDTPLYIDPYVLSTRTDEFSLECAEAVSSFFQELINCIRAGDTSRAQLLLSHLHEPNETCLGLSLGRSSGRGVGGLQSNQLYSALSRSTAVRTGFVQDLSDCELVVEGIGPDKISDITTNLIRAQLIRYTQEQCAAHGIPLTGTYPSGPIWSPVTMSWDQSYVQMPVFNGRRILLVPKFIVRWHTSMSYREYYTHFVLNFIQANPAAFGGLTHLARTRSGVIPKRELQDAFPCGKEFLLQFSENHPGVFEDYKRRKAAEKPLTNEELEEFDPALLAHYFSAQLSQVPRGRSGETQYHRLIAAILTFLFYPNLVTPRIEEPVNDGKKRIDITYVNAAVDGLFKRFTAVTGRSSLKIIAECKNYSSDVGNPEVDQLLGRFAGHRGWLGFLLSRTVDNPARLLERCRDVARDFQGYILAFDDRDIFTMLELVAKGQSRGVVNFVEARFNALTI